MGILIQDVPDIPASSLDISVPGVDLDITGDIIWRRQGRNGTHIGVHQAGPLQGDVHRYRLADLLIGIQRMGKTGVLRIETPLSASTIYFRNGKLIFATTGDEEKEVVTILRHWGRIGPEEHDRLIELLGKSGDRRWSDFVNAGHVAPKDLFRAVYHMAEKTLLELFHLEQGTFFFREELFPEGRIVSLPFNTVELVYRGVKTRQDEGHIRSFLARMNSIVSLNAETADVRPNLKLNEAEKKVLQLADGTRTIQEIAGILSLTDVECLSIIEAFSQAQVLKIGVDEIRIDAAGGEVGTEAGTTETERESEAVSKIDELYHEHRARGYHGILNISPNASADEIKRAYYRRVREFHPDRYLHLQSDEVKERLNTVFAYLTEAYKALTSPQGREQSGPASMPASDNETDRKNTAARKKFDEGVYLFERNHFDEALVLLGQAAYLDGSVADYHYYYGLSLLRHHKIKDAEISIRKASQLDPYNADYIAELGHIYLSLGFETRARNTFEKALKFNPSNQRASVGLKSLS